jgi:hypothetical protein
VFSIAHSDVDRKISNEKEAMQYIKITHNPLLLLFKQKSKKKIMGISAETVLIFGSTFYINGISKYRKLPAEILFLSYNIN